MAAAASAGKGRGYHKVTLGKTVFEVDVRYMNLKPIGRGAYGLVASADDLLTGTKVAIKRISRVFADLVDAKRILREIKLLNHFGAHDNVIAVSDIMTGPPNTQDFHTLYIVTKLYECDLERIVSSGQTLTDQHYQYFVYQILRGLKYIHSANVLHRDLKPGNLLVNSNCDLCICDFGLARGVSAETEGNLTEYVVTRWYRAPELLCESETYGAGVDVWSAGCIFGELLARRPLFKGKSTSKQLELIVSTLGTPTADEMKKITSPGALQVIQALPPRKKITLADWKKIFPHADESALDLLHSMLQFDPDKRVSLIDALNHPYLKELHAKAREPVSDSVFDFEYEKDYPDEMPQALLQKYMFEEMVRLQEINASQEASAKAGAESESKK